MRRWVDLDKLLISINAVFDSRTAKKVSEYLDSYIAFEEEPMWIPVEVKLPEKDATYYLVTTMRSPRVEMAWYLGGDWYWNNSDAKMGGVLAWMPLPELYRPEALREAGAEAGQDAAAQVLQPAT